LTARQRHPPSVQATTAHRTTPTAPAALSAAATGAAFKVLRAKNWPDAAASGQDESLQQTRGWEVLARRPLRLKSPATQSCATPATRSEFYGFSEATIKCTSADQFGRKNRAAGHQTANSSTAVPTKATAIKVHKIQNARAMPTTIMAADGACSYRRCREA